MNQTNQGGGDVSHLLQQYGCGPIQFAGTGNAFYERHLIFDNVVDPAATRPRERFEAVARSVRDILSQRWLRTEKTYEQENPKRIYYLSMEFLLGRSLANNVTNLLLESLAKQAAKEKNFDWLELTPSAMAGLPTSANFAGSSRWPKIRVSATPSEKLRARRSRIFQIGSRRNPVRR
jgi:hypothetical protein